ncbi:hypothetical protein GCM10010176_068270 [Nonomuraea spiralis]|nr:hypothetical protein GCM10010176_068270 [Nonomuraea spiralis]
MKGPEVSRQAQNTTAFLGPRHQTDTLADEQIVPDGRRLLRWAGPFLSLRREAKLHSDALTHYRVLVEEILDVPAVGRGGSGASGTHRTVPPPAGTPATPPP